jgi:L-asparaginase II
MYRRAGVSQGLIATGSEGMPLDKLTAARLARDGEKPSPVRHMCSGQHSVFLLLSRLKDWDPENYWLDDHPAQIAYREVVARAFGTTPGRLRTSIDGCGVATYAFPLRDIARAYALLADPSAVPAKDSRSSLAPALTQVRDAMLANPEMVGGTGREDTRLMQAFPGLLVKGGAEGVHCAALPDGRCVAVKITDGGDRARMPVLIAALRLLGVGSAGTADADGSGSALLDELGTGVVLGGGVPVGTVQIAPGVF